jgi:hypothetical protein
VHYVSYGTPNGEYESECRAAVVTTTTVDDSTVGLCVLNPTGAFFNPTVPYDDGFGPGRHCTGLNHAGGSWHWPNLAT